MRTLTTLAPALFCLAYFLVALAVFSVRSRFGRLMHDAEVDGRPASRLLGRFLRNFLMWVLAPYERLLLRLRISPNAVTLSSLGVAGGASVALAVGRFALGGWLYLGAGILDILDGRVARRTGRVSTAGAFLDSVVDRYAELLVFFGLAWYYRDRPVALVLVLLAALGSIMVSYARARGEALGVDVRVGAMQRPERIFYLGVVVAHAPLWEIFVGHGVHHPLFAPVVVALGALGIAANLTAGRRVVHTLRILDARARAEAPTPAEVPLPVASRGRRELARLLALLRTAG